MLSDDEGSLFGGSSDAEDGQASYSTNLALPSLKRKSHPTPTTSSDSFDGHRVGTSALSTSPLPNSERRSPAASSLSVIPCVSASSSSGSQPRAQTPLASCSPVTTTRSPVTAASPSSSHHLSAANPVISEGGPSAKPSARSAGASRKRARINATPAPTSFAILVQILRTDRTVTTLLQELLDHLKPPPVEPDVERRVPKRKDINGCEVTEAAWNALRTQELVRGLSSALQRGLKKAGAPADKTAVSDFQQVIQQWIFNKLYAYMTTPTPSTTPAPPTPTSIPSPFEMLQSVPLTCTQQLRPEQPNGSNLSPVLNGLGIDIPSPAIPSWDPTTFDFEALENLLGIDLSSQSIQADMTDIVGPQVTNQLSPFLNTNPWESLPSTASPPAHGVGFQLDFPANQSIDTSASPAQAVDSSTIPMVVYGPSATLPTWAQPAAASSSQTPLPTAESLEEGSGQSRTGQAEGRPIPDPGVPPATPTVRKSSKMEAALTRARTHRDGIQVALDKAMTTLWDLEIEHATLTKVVKHITEAQALSGIPRRDSHSSGPE